MTEAVKNPILRADSDSTSHAQQLGIATKLPYEEGSQSQLTTNVNRMSTDVAQPSMDNENQNLQRNKNLISLKNKRKRRRGKPKTNIKPYKKSNWKFQMPRHSNGTGVRNKLVRSRSIVPYNTNKFLMEEHMAEVPSALLPPSGRTRDSSFSVDSEDNYFFSLPEDEEEFLTKEFANVYEKARVERLEGMSKQQLIEECLQLEDRYAQTSDAQNRMNTIDFLNKIRCLEEKILELNAENSEFRRRLQMDCSQNKLSSHEERMVSSSEDSESDSSSSSSSSRASSEYGRSNHHSSEENDSDLNELKMASVDVSTGKHNVHRGEGLLNHNITFKGNLDDSTDEQKDSSPENSASPSALYSQRIFVNSVK